MAYKAELVQLFLSTIKKLYHHLSNGSSLPKKTRGSKNSFFQLIQFLLLLFHLHQQRKQIRRIYFNCSNVYTELPISVFLSPTLVHSRRKQKDGKSHNIPNKKLFTLSPYKKARRIVNGCVSAAERNTHRAL